MSKTGDKTRGWAFVGKAGVERQKLEEKKRKAKLANKAPFRFWLEKDSEGKGTFLDTPTFFFFEHQMKVDGKWGNEFTCVKEIGDVCIPCDMGDRPKYSLAATIIDRRVYTTKEGVRYKNTKKLIVFRGKAQEIILRRIQEKQDLRLATFKFCRGTSPNECNVGEDIQFVGRLAEEKLRELIPDQNLADRVKELVEKGKKPKVAHKLALDEYLEPYDYFKVLAPKDPAEIAALLGYDLESNRAVGDEDDEDEDADGTPDADENEEEENDDENEDPDEDDDDDDDADSGEDDDESGGEEEDPDADEDPEEEDPQPAPPAKPPKQGLKPGKPKPAAAPAKPAKPAKTEAAAAPVEKPKKPKKPNVDEADDITDLMD